MYLKTGHQELSTTTIYRWLETDLHQQGRLHHYLHRAYWSHRTRYGVPDRRHSLYDGRSIHIRPSVVEERLRWGDWEGDMMYGTGTYLVTLVD